MLSLEEAYTKAHTRKGCAGCVSPEKRIPALQQFKQNQTVLSLSWWIGEKGCSYCSKRKDKNGPRLQTGRVQEFKLLCHWSALSSTRWANITEPWNMHRRHQTMHLVTAQHPAVPGSNQLHQGSSRMLSTACQPFIHPSTYRERRSFAFVFLFIFVQRIELLTTYHFLDAEDYSQDSSCPALLSEFSQAPKPSPVASRSISNQGKASLKKIYA